MDSAPCPLLSAFVCALREHLRKTPMLHEEELEALDLLEQELAGEPPTLSLIWAQRARMCFVMGFAEASQHLNRLLKGAPSAETLLDDLIELHQAAAGEMGLLGIRRDGQQLEYAHHEVAVEVGEHCKSLVKAVFALRRATTDDTARTAASRVGVLLSDVLAAANTSVQWRLKYAKTLLHMPDNWDKYLDATRAE